MKNQNKFIPNLYPQKTNAELFFANANRRLKSGLSIILFVLLAACSAIGRESPTPTPLPALASTEKVIFSVERGPIVAQRDFYAEVVPAQQEELFFRASGFIARLAIEEGDRVKQGDVLAELQVDDLLNQLEQARLDLQTAQDNANNAELQRAYELQRATSDVTILQLQAIQAQQRADQAYGAAKEAAQTDLQITQERLKTAQAELTLMQGKKDTGSLAVVERAQLTVSRLETLLSERQIVAPYDGMVLKRYAKAGQNVDAFNLVFTVGVPNSLVVRIAYDDQMANVLEPTSEAYMSLTRSKEQLHPVKYLPDFLPVTNKKSGLQIQGSDVRLNYFYFTIPDDILPEQLSVGAGVTLVVILGRKEDALLLSPAAVRGSDAFRYVIVLEDDTHRRVEILQVGLTSDKYWEVIANLKEGDRVLGP